VAYADTVGPVPPDLDRGALDAHEQRLWGDIWKSAVPDAVAEHGIELRRFGPVQATLIADLPTASFLNLVLGAAAPGAVEEGHLAAAVDWADSLGVDYYVPVTPGLPEAAAAEDWLNRHGYATGYGWMKFARGVAPPDLPEPEGVDLVELAPGEGEAFSSIVAEGFGLPPWAGTLFFDLPGTEGWHCYLALVGGRPAATAAMLVGDGVAEFGLAATLEAARGRGCQLGLLRRRIVDAAAAGCHTLFVETGEQATDRPSGSYRNILRAGFEEAYLRPNWQPAAA
jgi:hypothetical protein